MEYSGHKRRFCATALAVICLSFLLALFAGEFEGFIAISMFGLPVACYTGLIAAGTYRVLGGRGELGDCGRVMNFLTSTLAKLLPNQNEP